MSGETEREAGKIKALVVPPTGVVTGPSWIAPTWPVIHGLIGGQAEPVLLPRGLGYALLDEDAKAKRQPVNRRVTHMLRLLELSGGVVAGTVVFVGVPKDDFTDVPQEIEDLFNGVDIMLGPGRR